MIFHYLKGYNSHLIMNVFNKSDTNVSVIPNGLEILNGSQKYSQHDRPYC